MRVVETRDQALALLDELYTVTVPVGIDTETVGCDPRKQSPVGTARLFCWSLAWDDQAVFLPYWDPEHERVLTVLLRWLEDPERAKVGHNVYTYDTHVFANHDVQLRGIVGDTLRMSRLHCSRKDFRHDLKSLGVRYLGVSAMGYDELCTVQETLTVPGKLKTYKRVGYVQGKLRGGEVQAVRFRVEERKLQLDALLALRPERYADLVRYATQDAVTTHKLYPALRGLLQSRRTPYGDTLHGSYQHLAHSVHATLGMESVGMAYHEAHTALETAAADLASLLADLGPLNWASSQQRIKYLRDDLGLPQPQLMGTMRAIKRADGWSTSEASLHWLRLQCPEHDALLLRIAATDRLRKICQYLRDLPGYRDRNGRIHTVLAPETETGRLSSRCPALQQIPSQGPWAAKYPVRANFVAPEDHSLVVVDYNQLEVYVLAHALLKLFGDDSIAAALASGDVYSAVARVCWPDVLGGLDDAAVKAHRLRKDAKIVVLATNYGKTPEGLAVSLLDDREVPVGIDYARAVLDVYNHKFPGIARYQDHMARYAQAHGGVWTMGGYWRQIMRADTPAGARQAANTPIQGSAAHIAAEAMVRVHTCPRLRQLEARLLLQVHDELIVECRTEHAPEVLALVTQHMENAVDLLVPLRAVGKFGPSWYHAK